MTLDQFLVYTSGPGVAIIVAVLMSLLAEHIPGFGELSPKRKRLLYGGLCLLVPLTAALIRAAGGYVPFSVDPLCWNALVAGAAALGVGTLTHTARLPTQQEKQFQDICVQRFGTQALSE